MTERERELAVSLNSVTRLCQELLELSPGADQLGTKKEAGKEWKKKLKERAQMLFPGLHVTLKTADALLILEAMSRLYSDPF